MISTAAALSILLFVHGQANTVEFSPSPVVFEAIATPVTVTITQNGGPLPAGSIGRVRFLIEGRDYSHMMRIEVVPVGLRLRPTRTLEIGTYQVEVTIAGRAVVLPAIATLTGEADSIANRAKAQGRSEAEILRELGLYTEGRESVNIALPEFYYVGKQVRIDMDTPEGAAYSWSVNGESAAQGQGAHEFTFVLRAAGPYEFVYTETPPGKSRIEARARTEAREEDPVAVTVTRGRRLRLSAPTGYAGYSWLIDGQPFAEGPEFLHAFMEPGDYRVECVATGNAANQDEAFRGIVYLVTVK